ncbi:MAG: DUF4912 domain-containing protein [Planctomycetota bacterium]|nr:DUF4912 domain-containing protein [Planctomycetota bacterium]
MPQVPDPQEHRIPRPPEVPETIYIDHGPDLPGHYGRDAIFLLVRDPECAFAYWELEAGRIGELKKKIGEDSLKAASWMLRVLNLSSGETAVVNIANAAGNWYIGTTPDTRYRVEIGVFTSDGVFHVLAVSNEVSTPRRGLSRNVDTDWPLTDAEESILGKGEGHDLPRQYDRKYPETS